MTVLGCVLLGMALAVADVAGDHWDLASEDTALSVSVRDNQPLILLLHAAAQDVDWLKQPAAIPLMSAVWVNGVEQRTQWRFLNAAQQAGSSLLTLTFENAEPKLQLRSIWRARPGRGPVEHWIEIENKSGGTVALTHQESLCLAATPHGEDARLWWIKRGGSNASTQGGVTAEPWQEGLERNLVSNCEDGSSPVPWLAVQVGEQCGLYLGWEFSGLGRIQAEVHGDSVALRVGLLPEFKTDIAPGETFQVPPAFIGAYTGDIDEGAYALHRWIIEKLRPALPEDIADPTLAYNLYLDAGGNHALEADVMRSAAFCRDIGFETFMPDAMWFPETGDWRWDPARFQNGVRPIEEYVHANGMRLALWCAWTNGGISEDPGALSVLGRMGHPDWFSGDVPPDWKPAAFSGVQVCLACPEARAWETQKTQWLVSNHKLDYLKHDCGPIVNHCNKTTHRHHYEVDASYWATMGYYEVQEKLRQAFPRIILENCSGGGHIKDFGVIQRTHYTVTTDTLSNLPDRQSLYDSTYAFPPLLLQAYTYERSYNVPGDDPEPYLWRSAMMGAWQIDPTNTLTWTEEQQDLARQSAQIYKDWVRPMLKDVKVHHILPRPDGVHWDGMFYWSPSLRRGTLYAFRPDAPEEEKTIRLKGLQAETQYWVWSQDGSVDPAACAGETLMRNGLTLRLPHRFDSDLVYLQDAALGKPQGLEPPEAFALGAVETNADAFTTSATLHWTPSAHAENDRVVLSESPGFDPIALEKASVKPAITLTALPANKAFHWKVLAVSHGGKCWNTPENGAFTTPKCTELAGLTFVSDLPWLSATAGAGNSVHRDTNYGGKTIQIAGKAYPKGVWTHAFNDGTPADLVLDIAGKDFADFAADAGVEASTGNGTVQFQVLVDGAVKAESPVLRSGGMHRFQVEVRGAKQITLRVLNGGDGFACDHAAWGFARFRAEGAKDPL